MLIHRMSFHGSASLKILQWVLICALTGAAAAFIQIEMQPVSRPAEKPLVDIQEELSVVELYEDSIDQSEPVSTPIFISTLPTQETLLLNAPPDILEDIKAPKEKRFSYHINSEYANSRNVRAVNITAGMSYNVDDKSKIGIEASQEVHDMQDAKAWGRDHEDNSEARIKYFLSF